MSVSIFEKACIYTPSKESHSKQLSAILLKDTQMCN